jgi:hypothetical protein
MDPASEVSVVTVHPCDASAPPSAAHAHANRACIIVFPSSCDRAGRAAGPSTDDDFPARIHIELECALGVRIVANFGRGVPNSTFELVCKSTFPTGAFSIGVRVASRATPACHEAKAFAEPLPRMIKRFAPCPARLANIARV